MVKRHERGEEGEMVLREIPWTMGISDFYIFWDWQENLYQVFKGFLSLWYMSDQKLLGGKRIYLILQLSGHTPSLREATVGTQDRVLGEGTAVETIEEHCLLISLTGCSACFLIESMATSPGKAPLMMKIWPHINH